MTTNTNTATLINSAIKDAAEATTKNGTITIYVDPNEGGWAWTADQDDYITSGPIGHDAEFYGERNSDEYGDTMFAVGAALEAAGYEVAR